MADGRPAGNLVGSPTLRQVSTRAVCASLSALLLASSAPLAADPRPVVVELFTSQGCSSCPPADRLLSLLGAEHEQPVVALAYHVDYWNHLGWRDPFSSRQWSQRQEAYARQLGTHLYTPQAVVDGRVHLVGSDERALRAAVAAAARRPAASVRLSLTPRTEELVAELEIELPKALRQRPLEVFVALFESGLETPVARGENGGRALREDYVVHRLSRAGALDPSDGPAPRRLSVTIPTGSHRQAARIGVAAFVQDPSSGEILGSTARDMSGSGR